MRFKQKAIGAVLAVSLSPVLLDFGPAIIQSPFVMAFKTDCMPAKTAFANNFSSLVYLARGPQVDAKMENRTLAEEWAREKHYEMTVELPARTSSCYWIPSNLAVKAAQSYWGTPKQNP